MNHRIPKIPPKNNVQTTKYQRSPPLPANTSDWCYFSSYSLSSVILASVSIFLGDCGISPTKLVLVFLLFIYWDTQS